MKNNNINMADTRLLGTSQEVAWGYELLKRPEGVRQGQHSTTHHEEDSCRVH